MSRDPEAICQAFVRDMQGGWGPDLVWVILYGSAARDDFVPRRSDYNFLVVVKDVAPDRLRTLGDAAGRWRKDRVAAPVFMRPEMIPTALDSYPLEFLTMKAAYRVLHGEDPLRELSLRPEDVRLQCERELRGKLLHLRAGAIDTQSKRE